MRRYSLLPTQIDARTNWRFCGYVDADMIPLGNDIAFTHGNNGFRRPNGIYRPLVAIVSHALVVRGHCARQMG